MVKLSGKKTTETKKSVSLKFVIDCSQPVEDGVLVTSDFLDFL
jgi:hypothetical protein